MENEEQHHNKLRKYNIDAKAAMFTILLSIFVDMLGYSMILPLLPSIAVLYGASDILIGILIASNAFVTLIMGPIWGKLSDSHGRKPILLICQIGTLASFLILGISDSIPIIFVSRILDGIFGGQFPIIKAYISDITTPQTRPMKVAKIQVATAVSLILGPSIGGFLGEINWRYPAFLASFLALLTIFLTIKVLIESMPKERIKDIKEELKNKRELIEYRSKKTIFSSTLVLRLIQMFLINLVILMFTSSVPLIIIERYSRTTKDIGLIMTFVGLVMILNGGFVMKILVKRIGEKKIFIISTLILIPTFLSFDFLYQFWMLYIFVIPLGYGRAVIGPFVQSNITKTVEADKQGVVSGWSSNMQSIAQTLAPLISTAFLEVNSITFGSITIGSYGLIGYTAGFFAILLSLIVFFDLKKHKDLYIYEKSEKPSFNL